jgi:hypothetical protein
LRAKGFYVHPWPWWWSLIGSMSIHDRDDEAWLALCPPMALMMKLDLALCPPMALMMKAWSPLEYPRKDMCLFHVFKCN